MTVPPQGRRAPDDIVMPPEAMTPATLAGKATCLPPASEEDNIVRVQRNKLSDILRQDSERDRLKRAWDATNAAEDFTPLPAGEYDCRILQGELFKARTGTPGYKLTFEVTEGEHAGRRVWHDIWLTPQALPMAKRDLGKLGISSVEQLEQPFPRGILARVKVALRTGDDGTQFNRVRAYEVTGTEPPDPFAPADARPDEPPCPFDDGKAPEGADDEGDGAASPGWNGKVPAEAPLLDGEAHACGPYGGDRL